jgi:hypothetical protein
LVEVVMEAELQAVAEEVSWEARKREAATEVPVTSAVEMEVLAREMEMSAVEAESSRSELMAVVLRRRWPDSVKDVRLSESR